jgi:hypothetical protein
MISMSMLVGVGLGTLLFMAAALLKARAECGGGSGCSGCENSCRKAGQRDG